MLKVGITGGIGSGKSVVCQVFQTLGIPVFNADEAGRKLMETDAALIANIKKLLGDDSYNGNKPNREKIASIVFSDKDKLQQLNALVHPAVLQYGTEWMIKQTTPYAIKEAAIFFESGSYKEMDIMIGVYAPEEVRIQRALQRGNITEADIKQRIANQMNEDEKMKRCDYVITNDGNTAIIPQVMKLHKTLLAKVAL
jgi:dephospho-CoA kinase